MYQCLGFLFIIDPQLLVKYINLKNFVRKCQQNENEASDGGEADAETLLTRSRRPALWWLIARRPLGKQSTRESVTNGTGQQVGGDSIRRKRSRSFFFFLFMSFLFDLLSVESQKAGGLASFFFPPFFYFLFRPGNSTLSLSLRGCGSRSASFFRVTASRCEGVGA